MTFIFEKLLLEYSEKTKKDFYGIFAGGDEKVGKELLDTFDKSKQLLLNNNVSNDIQKWISDAKKDPEKVDELKNILHNLRTRQNRIDKNMDIRKKKIPGKYKELWKGNGETLYRIDDVVASMALGVNTGWCTTGRYEHAGEPDFVPSRKDAETHFNDHNGIGRYGIGKLYYLVDDETGYGLYAWHFQADMHGNYCGYSSYDDLDDIIHDAEEDEDDEVPPDYDIEKTMYDDFMECVENIMENAPKFDIVDGYLKHYFGNEKRVIVPDSVIMIGVDAFSHNENIIEIMLPDNLKEIGVHAFGYCTALTAITIPEGVTKIGNSAFHGCKKLTSVTIPDSVTEIGNHAFNGCVNLTNIKFPDGDIAIGFGAFSGCRSLADDNGFIIIKNVLYEYNGDKKDVRIPNSVISIRERAFYERDDIIEVTIPDSVTSIGSCAFYRCKKLTSITIPGSVTSIGDGVFTYCTSLKSVTIPDSVTSIGRYVFEGCTSLTDITIQGPIISIDNGAFAECKALTSITIPNSVTSIGSSVFSNCTNLTSISIPDNVTYIGGYAFSRCDSLTSVTIPDSVTYIGNSAFHWCSKLESVKIPNSVTQIGEDAFYHCTILKSVTIPDSVTSIGSLAFSWCTRLKSVTIPDSVTSIGHKAFWMCDAIENVYYSGTEDDWGKIKIATGNDILSKAEIHFNSPTHESFENSNTMKFIFKQSLLEEYSNKLKQEFYDVFTDGDEKEGGKLLDTFDKSKQLLLNNSISNDIQKWISDAKKDSSKVSELKNILYNLNTRQNKIDKGMDIRQKKVPGEYKILWQGYDKTLYRIDDVVASMALGVNTGWCTTGRYGHYGEPNFVPSRENAERHFNDHQDLDGDGVGKLYYLVDDDTGYGLYAWHFQADRDGSYSGYTHFDDKDNEIKDSNQIPTDKLGTIAYNDFMENIYDYIADIPTYCVDEGTFVKFSGTEDIVVVPDGIVEIGYRAFADTYVKSVYMPDSVTYIGEEAFAWCIYLEGIDIPESVEDIDWGAFKYCTSLTSVTIPDSVKRIGSYAFDDCENLTSINIPNSVTEIGQGAFNSCWELKTIKLSSSITNILDNTFYFCTSLESIYIPDGVRDIGSCAFFNCKSLEKIILPRSIRGVDFNAFKNCTGLRDVYYSGTEEEWERIAIEHIGNDILLNANIHFNSGEK